jgi:hypothetical protein
MIPICVFAALLATPVNSPFEWTDSYFLRFFLATAMFSAIACFGFGLVVVLIALGKRKGWVE